MIKDTFLMVVVGIGAGLGLGGLLTQDLTLAAIGAACLLGAFLWSEGSRQEV